MTMFRRKDKTLAIIEEANRVADEQAASAGRALMKLHEAVTRLNRAERRLTLARASLDDERRRHAETRATLNRLLTDLHGGQLTITTGAER